MKNCWDVAKAAPRQIMFATFEIQSVMLPGTCCARAVCNLSLRRAFSAVLFGHRMTIPKNGRRMASPLQTLRECFLLFVSKGEEHEYSWKYDKANLRAR